MAKASATKTDRSNSLCGMDLATAVFIAAATQVFVFAVGIAFLFVGKFHTIPLEFTICLIIAVLCVLGAILAFVGAHRGHYVWLIPGLVFSILAVVIAALTLIGTIITMFTADHIDGFAFAHIIIVELIIIGVLVFCILAYMKYYKSAKTHGVTYNGHPVHQYHSSPRTAYIDTRQTGLHSPDHAGTTVRTVTSGPVTVQGHTYTVEDERDYNRRH